MLNLLLIDDDESEFRLIQRTLKDCYNGPFSLRHADSLIKGIAVLKSQDVDVILLDDKLSHNVTAKQSVPALRAVSSNTPLIVISSIINAEYLTDKSYLGVYDVIDKYNLRERIREGLFIDLQTTVLIGKVLSK